MERSLMPNLVSRLKRRLPAPMDWPIPARRALRIVRRPSARRALTHAGNIPPLPENALDSAYEKPALPPVFVVSAGWRSGSTALQRLIISGGDAFIFGEPFANSRLIPRLERIVTSSTVLDNRDDYVINDVDIDAHLAKSWIARVNPHASELMWGVRNLLEATYWRPLQKTSFRTWGAKEVALTPKQLRLLLTAFPDATFLCIIRNPEAAYRSFRNFVVGGVDPRSRYRGEFSWVINPIGFGRIWSDMARTFRAIRTLPNVHVYRYEDINNDTGFPDRLGEALGMTLDNQVWATRLGSSARAHDDSLPYRAERILLRRATSSERQEWGYRVRKS